MKKSASKATLSDVICEKIKNDLLLHDLQPGQKINTKELAVRYGVSETPVKIALNRLISENIVENYPRQGMYIKPVDIDGCRETFELRKMMECYYADKMVHVYSVDAQFRKHIQENIDRHMDMVRNLGPGSTPEDYLMIYKYEDAFHDMLISCSSSKLLITTYKNLNPFLYANYVYAMQSKDRLILGVTEHQEVLDAIKSGDLEKVKQKIINHMDRGSDSITAILLWDRYGKEIFK